MKGKRHTLNLAYIATGAVLITVCSWLSIPTAVPFTMQTFAVFAVLAMLGGIRGTASIVIYILLGKADLFLDKVEGDYNALFGISPAKA